MDKEKRSVAPRAEEELYFNSSAPEETLPTPFGKLWFWKPVKKDPWPWSASKMANTLLQRV